MVLANRRRTATTGCVALCCLYTLLSLVDRRRELLRSQRQQLEEDVAEFVSNEVGRADLAELIKVPGMMLPSDQRLVDIIRNDYLQPPPWQTNYNLSAVGNTEGARVKGEQGQSVLVDRLLRRKKNGFFIEAGAFDGEYLSNTLFFELRRNWTGLLVEPNQRAFERLKSKGRKAFSVNSCLSLRDWPEEVDFDAADVYGTVITDSTSTLSTQIDNDANEYDGPANITQLRNALGPRHRRMERVQCFPLYSLMLALDNPIVNYLSLDVEGAELEVLRTVPFDKVQIDVISVEVVHSSVKEIVELLTNKGYRVVRRLRDDIVFQRVKQSPN